jgi:hypothetical protein
MVIPCSALRVTNVNAIVEWLVKEADKVPAKASAKKKNANGIMS